MADTAPTQEAVPAQGNEETAPASNAEADKFKALEEKTKQDAFRAMDAARRFRKDRDRFQKTQTELQTKLQALEAKLSGGETEAADMRRAPAKWLERMYGPKWKDSLAQVAMTEQVTPDMV